MSWYKKAQFNQWQPVRFVNPLTGQPSAGVFDKDLGNGRVRVRIGDMVGRPVIIPINEIETINEETKFFPGQKVSLVKYPTESPAEIIADLGNGRYSVLPKSNRQMELPINEIVPLT
jgi:hypothetical protein